MLFRGCLLVCAEPCFHSNREINIYFFPRFKIPGLKNSFKVNLHDVYSSYSAILLFALSSTKLSGNS